MPLKGVLATLLIEVELCVRLFDVGLVALLKILWQYDVPVLAHRMHASLLPIRAIISSVSQSDPAWTCSFHAVGKESGGLNAFKESVDLACLTKFDGFS